MIRQSCISIASRSITRFGADWIVSEVDTGLSGRVNIAATAGTPLTQDERLLNLHFAIQPDVTLGDSSEIVLERILVNGGQLLSSSQNATVMIGSPSDIDDHVPILPQQFALYQNYPNPFNPSTTVRYDVPQSSHVRIAILDMLGRHVKTLVDSDRNSGQYHAVWDARDDNAVPVAAGIYFCRMETGTFVSVVKLALVK